MTRYRFEEAQYIFRRMKEAQEQAEKARREREQREQERAREWSRTWNRDHFGDAFGYAFGSAFRSDDGKPGSVTSGELTSTFRRLSKKWHPDKGGTTEAMQALNEFYEELKKLL